VLCVIVGVGLTLLVLYNISAIAVWWFQTGTVLVVSAHAMSVVLHTDMVIDRCKYCQLYRDNVKTYHALAR